HVLCDLEVNLKQVCLYGLVIFLLLFTIHVNAQSNDARPDSVLENALKIYVDCSNCDNDFIRREISFVNFVRDRNQADVHLLVTRQNTGSGGSEYMVEFIGKKNYSNMIDTLIFNTKETDTDDEIRAQVVKYFKLGLTRFIAKTDLSKHVTVSFDMPTKQSEVKDKWKNWVFEIEIGGWLNGDANYRVTSLYSDVEAHKVIDEWKVGLGLWGNYNEQKFTNDGSSDKFISRSKGTYGQIVYSLNDKWSTAYEYNIFASTFANKDFDFSTELGLEYNIFPYDESSRRIWIFRYNMGVTYIDHTELTVYGEYNQWLTYNRLRSAIKVKQPWGSLFGSLNGIVYLHDLNRNRLTLSGGFSVNLFEGFELNAEGNYSRTRDQISLSAAGLSEADRLLRQREIASGYNYWTSISLSYTLGSIYNNIVNPRF
ncbi:MAG: hypothetical protein ACU84J_09265, partial [Gammaproteobacteria bacterium]